MAERAQDLPVVSQQGPSSGKDPQGVGPSGQSDSGYYPDSLDQTSPACGQTSKEQIENGATGGAELCDSGGVKEIQGSVELSGSGEEDVPTEQPREDEDNTPSFPVIGPRILDNEHVASCAIPVKTPATHDGEVAGEADTKKPQQESEPPLSCSSTSRAVPDSDTPGAEADLTNLKSSRIALLSIIRSLEKTLCQPKIRQRKSGGEAKKTEVTSPSLQLPSDLNNERASHRRRNIRYPDYGTINIIHNPLSSRSPNVPSSLRQDGLYNNIRGRSDHREEFWQSGLSAVENARDWALPGERNENRERRMDRVFGQLLSGLPDQNISPTRGTTEPNGDINQSPDHMAHKQVLLQGDPGDPTRCMYSSEEEDHLSGRSSEQESKIGYICPICMDPDNGDSLVKTTCKHIFHRKCLKKWQNTCPLCRTENPLGLSQDDSPNTDVAEEPESQQRAAVCNVYNHSDQGSASQLHPGSATITVLDHAGQFLRRLRTPLTSVQNFARSIHAIVFENLVLTSFTLRYPHGYNIPWNTPLGYQDTTVQVFPADEHGSWSWRLPIDDEGFAGPPEQRE